MGRLGHQVSYFPIGNPDAPQCYHDELRIIVENAKMFGMDAPCLRIWHQHDMAQRVGVGPYYGMPIFELDTFSDIEKHHLSTLDHVIVNSHWAKRIIIDQVSNLDNSTVHVVPLGVDRGIFNTNGVHGISESTIFINFGKWEIRKGHDILIKAFERAFGHDDKVELWMCCENPFYDEAKNKEWADYYINSKLGDKVRMFPRQEDQEGVARLMNMADCGVFPSRGEGWNLELLEMMSCGKQVIATNYSAHTEFISEDNCLLIGTDFDVEPAYDGVWFHGQGNWAKIEDKDITEMAMCMRMVHEDKQSGKDMINHEGIETAIEYSWENATKELMHILWRTS